MICKRIDIRKIVLLFVALFSITVSGQESATKLDMYLNGMVQNGAVVSEASRHKVVRKNAAQTECVVVNAILEKGAELPVTELQELGIEVEDRVGRFLTMLVPVSKIADLDALPGFEQFDLNRAAEPTNARSKEVMGVNELQSATSAKEKHGLSQTYTGKGVVVGVFDQGIDFNHNNFRSHLGTHPTRIQKAYVYSGSYASPATTADNTSAINALTSDCTTTSHGTHTTSTAAGCYDGDYVDKDGALSCTNQRGVAYESDLVLCGTPNLYFNQMKNAMGKMFDVAEAQEKPLVVNLSLGITSGWMDGSHEMCKYFDDFTDNGNKPGRIVCISAGNEGNQKFTMYRELNAENDHTIRTFMPKSNNGSTYYFNPQVFIYVDDATPVTVEFERYNSSLVYQAHYTETESFSAAVSGTTYSAHNGRYGKSVNSTFRTYFNSSSTDEWALKITSSRDCKVRVFAATYDYASQTYELCDMESKGKSGFVSGDATSSINSLACTNSVLSVGAWQAYNDINHCYDGLSHTYASSSNNKYIANFSSWAERDDNGVARPDFAAPGVAIISGYNSYDTNVWQSGTAKSNKVVGKASENWLSGHISLVGSMSGTSMACPNAVGVIALWLQADPTLSVNRVREIIKATADTDEMTREQNPRFGAGKLNALAGLKMIARKEVSITDAQYATFYAGHNVIVPKGVEVYAPTISRDNTTLLMGEPLEAGTILPAKTGVVVKADAGENFTFVATNEQASDITSCLQGSLVAQPVTDFEGQIYSLAREDGVTAFYRYTGSSTAAGKAFLVLDANTDARQLLMNFDESTSGVIYVNKETKDDVIYNLNGQRMTSIPCAGFYIIGGKKVLVTK